MTNLLRTHQLRVGDLLTPNSPCVTNIVKCELLASLTGIRSLSFIRSTFETIQYEKQRVDVDGIPFAARISVHTCSSIGLAFVTSTLQTSMTITLISFLALPILTRLTGVNIHCYIKHKLTQLDPHQEGLTTFQRVRNVAIIVIAAAAATAMLLFATPHISACMLTSNFISALCAQMVSVYLVQPVAQAIFFDSVDTVIGIGRCTADHVKIDGWYEAGLIPHYHPEADIGDSVSHILPNKIEIIDSMRRVLEMSGKSVNKVIINNTIQTDQPSPFFDYVPDSQHLIVNLPKLNAYKSYDKIDCSQRCLNKQALEKLHTELKDSELNISSAVLVGGIPSSF